MEAMEQTLPPVTMETPSERSADQIMTAQPYTLRLCGRDWPVKPFSVRQVRAMRLALLPTEVALKKAMAALKDAEDEVAANEAALNATSAQIDATIAAVPELAGQLDRILEEATEEELWDAHEKIQGWITNPLARRVAAMRLATQANATPRPS